MPERRRPVAAMYAPETTERAPVGTACRPSCCKSPYGHSTVKDHLPAWHRTRVTATNRNPRRRRPTMTNRSEHIPEAFDRWLAAVRREAAAEAVEQFAADMHEWYPEDVFPKPTPENYHDLNVALARANITLDRFSADLMRRGANLARERAAEIRAGGNQ